MHGYALDAARYLGCRKSQSEGLLRRDCGEEKDLHRTNAMSIIPARRRRKRDCYPKYRFCQAKITSTLPDSFASLSHKEIVASSSSAYSHRIDAPK